MGVDINKLKATGVFFTHKEIGETIVPAYFESADPDKYFGQGVVLQDVNPYGGKIELPGDYFIGIVEENEEGDGDRADSKDTASYAYLPINEGNKAKVEQILKERGVDITGKEIRTCSLVFLS